MGEYSHSKQEKLEIIKQDQLDPEIPPETNLKIDEEEYLSSDFLFGQKIDTSYATLTKNDEDESSVNDKMSRLHIGASNQQPSFSLLARSDHSEQSLSLQDANTSAATGEIEYDSGQLEQPNQLPSD